ncbi:MAG: right-handed parallel beta-helix repeat-containing protein, partial [Solirubrobacterales bacterium]
MTAALIVAPPSSAAVTCTKYASLSGNDANPGTDTAPYLTIQHLVDSLSPGQTGCAHAGTYSATSADHEAAVDFNHGGTAGAPVTLTTAPGDPRATLRLRLQISTGSDYVTVSNLNIDGEDNPQKTPEPIVDGDHAILTSNDITNHQRSSTFNTQTGLYVGNICVSVAGADALIQFNTIHDCGNKADPDPDGSRNHDHGIYVTGGTRAQIWNNWIYDNAARGIQFFPDADANAVIANVIDGNGEGIVFSGDAVNTAWASDDNLVARNMVSNSELRYNIYGHWPLSVGNGNVARDNCVYATASGFTAEGG